MDRSTFTKIEEFYLKIFKIVILVVLTVVLVISIVFAIMSVSAFLATPDKPVPAKTAPAPNVGIDRFLDELTKPKEPEQPAKPQPERSSPAPKSDPVDELMNEFLPKLWSHQDGFAKACGVEFLPMDAWMASFTNKDVLREWFRTWGRPFAVSQDGFEQAVLIHPRAIQHCKDKKGPVFFPSLNWHRTEWARQDREAKEFNAREIRRVDNFEDEELARVFAQKAGAGLSLMIAGGTFGVFMLLALLLIFAKIETNLRNGEIKEKLAPSDAAPAS